MSDTAPIEHPTWLTSGDFTLADEPLRLWQAWFDEAVKGELRDPTAMSLATVDPEGMPDVRTVLREMWTQPKFFEALGSQIETICESATDLMRTDPGDYRNVPLVVISSARADEARLKADAALAQRSRRGRHILADESGHWVPLDAPHVIIDAVTTMVREIRSGGAC